MCKKNIFKFGLEDPLTVEYALSIDQESGSTLWNEYIVRDMKKYRFA